jgi:hypothetical protein
MQRSTLVPLALALVLVLFTPQVAVAEELSEDQLGVLASAGIPLYPGSSYTTGDDEIATIMWFKSTDSPDTIMDWYKDKLSDWSEMDAGGSRVIYKGPAGLVAADLSTIPYLWARTKGESSVSTDSEITIRIPK